MDAGQSLARLKEGNARYAGGKRKEYDLPARRAELAAGQHPFVTILSCSDSRVVPEFIFDAQAGEIFVVRTAGNVAGAIDLGSLEYGCEHLHTPLLVVMGHSGCGAVKATCECKGRGGEGNIKSIVEAVAPAAGKKSFSPAESVVCNVECSIENIRQKSHIVSHLEKEGKLKIIGALYSLETGRVEFI